eukprot:TRINITY_DN1875_c0_g1_i1.p1 TRINITY_DN1875_c0_g1~~TRINITY_DN1875_c0_g1_i1.p1  ORF type:complete len:223 (+),score=90.87 TRINITY_DN1875_c0_g1_i1:37-705(+)
MNNTATEQAIQRMVQFIDAEAREQANEIKFTSKKEAEKLKQTQIGKEKTLIDEYYEKKKKDLSNQERILKSNLKINSNLLYLKSKQEALDEMLKKAHSDMIVAYNDKKEEILFNFILEGMIALLEDKYELLIAEEDVSIINDEFIERLKEKYMEITGIELIKCCIIENNRLNRQAFGGVIVFCSDRKISFNNTLQEKLLLTLKKIQPDLVAELFHGLDDAAI